MSGTWYIPNSSINAVDNSNLETILMVHINNENMVL